VRIIAEIVDQIAPVHVEHRADRNERAEPDVLPQTPVQHRRAQRTALTDERNPTRPRHRCRERRVQACDRVHYAQAVRAHDPHLPASRRLQHPSLQLDPLRADFLESRRDDDGAGNAQIRALLHDRRDRGRGCDDDGKVHRLRHVTNARVRFDSEHARALFVHGKNHPAKRRADQIPENRAANAPDALRRSYQGDTARCENRIERPPAWARGAHPFGCYRVRHDRSAGLLAPLSLPGSPCARLPDSEVWDRTQWPWRRARGTRVRLSVVDHAVVPQNRTSPCFGLSLGSIFGLCSVWIEGRTPYANSSTKARRLT
jgi:hypothetical protein